MQRALRFHTITLTMLHLTINFEDAAAKATLGAIEQALQDRAGLHASMAQSVEIEVKGNLQAKYVPRNKRGDFWKRVHDSVEVHSSSSEAVVALVETGIGLRYYGGEVYPGKNPAASGPNKGQPTRALAIPSDQVPVANGRQLTPARMGLLAFLRAKTSGDTVGVLVEGQEVPIKRGPRKGQSRIVAKPGGSLLFTLRRVTRHTGDPGILPEEGRLLTAASEAAEEYLDSFEE